MAVAEKFTSADLLVLPEDGKRYEIIEGELYVSRQPRFEHQYTCGRVFEFLDLWDAKKGLGVTLVAPGLIFGENDDVAPDIIWISRERLEKGSDEAGHLRVAPELVVEVLSPGRANEERDRDAKLKLYSRRGVREYWIVNWMQQFVEVYRREEAALKLSATLHADEALTSPLLPGFTCLVGKLFFASVSDGSETNTT